jgi:hypothetical protein
MKMNVRFFGQSPKNLQELVKATIERSTDEEYANCPSPPKKQHQGMLEL